MNVLFLTYGKLTDIHEHSIYLDLIREFIRQGNKVYSVSPCYEHQYGCFEMDEYLTQTFVDINALRGGRNLIKKGMSIVKTQNIFKNAVIKYYNHVKFDLVLYTTPPITLLNAVKYVKQRDHATTYLLLKDIFPQNSVDLGIMNTHGIGGVVYRYFRRIEQELYRISDFVGCMSEANCTYIIEHNNIAKEKVEVCPNSIDVFDKSISKEKRIEVRERYNLPLDKVIFVYGGNLGKPQDIPFIIECLKKVSQNERICILIIGNGSEYRLLNDYYQSGEQRNFILKASLPKEDYDTLVAACDVGLIFLDHRFTIPNFPSRILGYMQAKLPVLACTDINSDIGKVISNNGFGWWCESNNTENFEKSINKVISADRDYMGRLAYKYLEEHYTSKNACEVILRHFEGML